MQSGSQKAGCVGCYALAGERASWPILGPLLPLGPGIYTLDTPCTEKTLYTVYTINM